MTRFKRRERKRDPNTGKKRPGPDISHGAYSINVRARYSDLRTVEGQRLNTIVQGLISDLGGPEQVNTSQNILIETIKSKLIILFQISEYTDKQVCVIDEKSGELLKCLGRNFISYTEALRRDLEALQKFSNNKIPGDLYEQWRDKFFKDAIDTGKGAGK